MAIELILREMPNPIIKSADRTVARQAAELRVRNGLDPIDAIIAATALVERCDVIIGNDAMMASRLAQIPYLYLNNYA